MVVVGAKVRVGIGEGGGLGVDARWVGNDCMYFID